MVGNWLDLTGDFPIEGIVAPTVPTAHFEHTRIANLPENSIITLQIYSLTGTVPTGDVILAGGASGASMRIVRLGD